MKTKLVIVPPAMHQAGGSAHLYEFRGEFTPLRHVAELPDGYIGIEARKKARELFGENFEFVTSYGQPMPE